MRLRNRAIAFAVTMVLVWNNAMAPVSLAYADTNALFGGLVAPSQSIARVAATSALGFASPVAPPQVQGADSSISVSGSNAQADALVESLAEAPAPEAADDNETAAEESADKTAGKAAPVADAPAGDSDAPAPADEPDASASDQSPAYATELTKKLKSVDGCTYVVRIKADDAAAIPADATLEVVELTKAPTASEKRKNPDAYKDRPTATERMLNTDEQKARADALAKALSTKEDDEVIWSKYLDVKIKAADGKEVAPAAAVTVEVESNAVAPQSAPALEAALVSGESKALEASERTSRIETYTDAEGKERERAWSKVTLSADRLGELAVAVVAAPVRTWQLRAGNVALLGPRVGVNAWADDAEAAAPEGTELQPEAAFVAMATPAENVPDATAGRGIQLWVRATAAPEATGGIAVWHSDANGASAQLLAAGEQGPAVIMAGERVDLLWDQLFERQTLTAGDVTLEGALPQGAEATAADLTSELADPTKLEGDAPQAQPGEELKTVAAYSIALEVGNEEYAPDEAHPVEAIVATDAVAKADPETLEVWRVDGTQATPVDADATDDAVSFDATAMGTYIVVERKSITKTIVASDNNTYTITATFGPDAMLPTNADLQVRELTDDERAPYEASATEAVGGGKLEYMRAFDITIVDAEGKELEPAAPVEVSIALSDGEAPKDAGVVHFADDEDKTAMLMDARAKSYHDKTVSYTFAADSFSVYAVTYTVDFHWGDYEFNMEGGTVLLLSELLEALVSIAEGESINGKTDSYDTNKLRVILDNPEIIKNVTFTNPELLEVSRAIVLDDEHIELQESDESEELVERTHVEWLLTSLAPFTSNETLTIYLIDGSAVEIPVTDAFVTNPALISRVSNTRVKVDGVVYNLYNTLYGTAYAAAAYAVENGATFHQGFVYNGITYTVVNMRLAESALTKVTSKIEYDVVTQVAGREIVLPTIKVDPDETFPAEEGWVAGNNNESDIYKVWKKAEYDDESGTINYTLKYFQSMMQDVPLSFIFIYDDSISMYSGYRESHNMRLGEAQTTRVLILDAVKSLLSNKPGYNIQIGLGGTSTGDDRYATGLTTYEAVEDYLSSYRTGVTDYTVGLNNALLAAQAAKRAGRTPIVVWLSDFHQAFSGSVARRTGDYGIADQLHAIAPVYGLSTDYRGGATVRNVLGDEWRMRIFPMRAGELDEGIESMESIIWDAIGYYMKDKVTVTDNLSQGIASLTPDGEHDSASAGNQEARQGRETWTLGGTSYIEDGDNVTVIHSQKAGQVYTESFSVELNENTIYAGSMPTNDDVTVYTGGRKVNEITDSPVLGASVNFVLGEMDKNNDMVPLDGKHLPTNTVKGISFKLFGYNEQTGTATNQIGNPNGSGASAPFTTDANGRFAIPYLDNEGIPILKPGNKYVLTEDSQSVSTYNDTATRLLVAPDKSWIISVDNKGIVTVSVDKPAAQTPEATIVTAIHAQGQPAMVALWNQIVVPAELVEITVTKTWQGGEDRPPVPFTVTGVSISDGSEHVLNVYSENNVNSDRISYLVEAECETSTDAEGNTVWSREVWVPDKIDNENVFYDAEKMNTQNVPEDIIYYEIVNDQKNLIDLSTLADEEGYFDYNQTYSYKITEGDLPRTVKGWYVPTETANSEMHRLQGYHKKVDPVEGGWKNYVGNTSYHYQVHYNNTGLKDFGGYTGDNAFYRGIETVEIEVECTADSAIKQYHYEFEPAAWDKNPGSGVIFYGLQFPTAWDVFDPGIVPTSHSNAANNYGAIKELKVTKFVFHMKNGNTVNIYKDGAFDGNNPYRPDSTNYQLGLYIERYNSTEGTHYNWNSHTPNGSVTSIAYKVPDTGTPETIDQGNTIELKNCTLAISNAWQDNRLVQVKVKKTWINSEGGSVPQNVIEQNTPLGYSLYGHTEKDGVAGEDTPVPVFESNSWSTTDPEELQELTKAHLSGDASDSEWEDTVYVPQYDVLGTYDPDTRTCLEYVYDNDSAREDQLVVLEGDAGEPMGEWREPDTSYTAGGMTDPVDRWVEVNPQHTQTKYFAFDMRASSLYWSGLRVEFTYNGVDYHYQYKFVNGDLGISESSNYWVTYCIPIKLDFPVSQLTNVTLTRSLKNSTEFSLPTNFSNNFQNFRLLDRAPAGSHKTISATKISTESLYYHEIIPATIVDPTFTITNTYTPYKPVKLQSEFTDITGDAQSTNAIKKVNYTVKQGDEVYFNTSAAVTNGTGEEKIVYLKPGETYTVEQTSLALSADGEAYPTTAYTTTYSVDSGAEVEGTSVTQAYNTPTTTLATIKFSNDRKHWDITVKTQFDPELSGEELTTPAKRPLSTDRNINYSFTYRNSAGELVNKTSPSTYVLNDSKFSQSAKNYTNSHPSTNEDAIPTYSIRGELTDCSISSANLASALPDYNAYIDTVEDPSGKLIFTVMASINRAPVMVSKSWDEDITEQEKAKVTLNFSIRRSDGEKIYGTNQNTVDLSVETDDNGDAVGTFSLGAGENSALIYLPVIRTSDLDASGKQVKYILTETGSSKGHYYVNYADLTGRNNAFEQTNPSGKSGTPGQPDTNEAKFVLGTKGMSIDVNNANKPYICKIVEDYGTLGTIEVPFRTLNKAVKYARAFLDGTATVQMLVDYSVPYTSVANNDAVTLDKATDNITLTTAETSGGVYNFRDTKSGKATDDQGTAILTRSHVYTLFSVKNKDARLAFEKVILDGEHTTATTGPIATNGGFVNLTSGTVNLNNGAILRNSWATNGGAVYMYAEANSTCALNMAAGAKIQNCKATNGGAIYEHAHGGNSNVAFTMSGGTIEQCEATTNGGAVYAYAEVSNSSASVTINDGTIDQCKATTNGGAVYAYALAANSSATVTMDDGTIKRCSAGVWAGAVYLYATVANSTSTFTMNDGLIDSCTAVGRGGAVYMYAIAGANSGFTMNDGTIQKCKTTAAAAEGGGVAFLENSGSKFTMNDGLIDSCESYNGGVVSSVCAGDVKNPIEFNIHGGTIKKCKATNYGGVANVHNHMRVNMTDGTITDCSADNAAGAIYLFAAGSLMNMTGGTITKCEAPTAGAVYVADAGTLRMSGGSITGNKTTRTNTTTTEAGSGVGAVEIQLCEAKVELSGNPVIYDNVDKDGKQANIRLNHNATVVSERVLRVVGDGLTDGAKIGVWPTYGANQDFDEQFAVSNEASSNARLSGFVNDYHSDHSGTGLIMYGYPGHVKSGITDEYKYAVIWKYAICKIVYKQGSKTIEKTFSTLNDAVGFAQENKTTLGMNATTPVKVQMLVDYAIPDYDLVTIDESGDNIVFTTAKIKSKLPAGETIPFVATFGAGDGRLGADSTETAILKRSATGNSLFSTDDNNVKLGFENVILDGNGYNAVNNTWGMHSSDGGGLVNVKGGTLTVGSGAELRNAKSENYGGAVCVASGTMNMTGGTIKRSTANIGGGVYVGAGATLNMTGGTITNCSANDGGAIGADHANAKVNVKGTSANSRVTITDCTAKYNGGGVFVNDEAVLDMDYVYMSGCFANAKPVEGKETTTGAGAFGGGAVAVMAMGWTASKPISSTGTIKNSVFEKCTTDGLGGAVFASRSSLTVEDSTFGKAGSKLDGNRGGSGGAMMLAYGANGTITRSNIYNASSGQGGGAFLFNSTATFTDVTMQDCTTTGPGGAIDIYGSTATIAGSTSITKCEATTAGSAIFAGPNAVLNMTGGGITNNTVSATVGAVDTQDDKARLNFSGSPTVYGNVYGSQQRNVVLNYDTNSIIQVPSAGLGSGANIGVYVTDKAIEESMTTSAGTQTENVSLYSRHGQAGAPFGTFANEANLNKFSNDRNQLAGVKRSVENDGLIYWQDNPTYLKLANGTNQAVTFRVYVDDGAYGLAVKRQSYPNQDFTVSPAKSGQSNYYEIPRAAGESETLYLPGAANKNARVEVWVNGAFVSDLGAQDIVMDNTTYQLATSYTSTGTLVDANNGKLVAGPEYHVVANYGNGNNAKDATNCYNQATTNAQYKMVYLLDPVTVRKTWEDVSAAGANKAGSNDHITLQARDYKGDALAVTVPQTDGAVRVSGTDITLSEPGTVTNENGQTTWTWKLALPLGVESFTEDYIPGFISEFGEFRPEHDSSVVISGTNAGAARFKTPVTVSNKRAVCKIVETREENGNTVTVDHPFLTLNEALEYARNNLETLPMNASNPVAIQMLVDYTVRGNSSEEFGPDNDRIVLGANDNIVITTAKTAAELPEGETYFFADTLANKADADKGKAILTRGYNGPALFVVDDGSAALAVNNVVLDGASATYRNAGMNGGLVSASAGSVSVGDGSVLRNSWVTSTAVVSEDGTIVTTATGNGGAIYMTGGSLSAEGASFDDCRAGANGGAVFLGDGATLRVGGENRTYFHDCAADIDYKAQDGTILSAGMGNGGAIYCASTATNAETGLTMDLSNIEILGHVTHPETSDVHLADDVANAVRGGAIYAISGSVSSLTESRITGNTASEDGAGIYLQPGATLNVSGNLDFGGTDRYTSANVPSGAEVDDLKGTDGNFVLKGAEFKAGSDDPTNGGRAYPTDASGKYKVRQDIFVEGYLGTDASGNPVPATGLNVTGAIGNENGANDGSIWVWATVPSVLASDADKENNHYQQLKQFATFGDDVPADQMDATLRAFRNSVDDERTGNNTDSFLCGTTEGSLDVPEGASYVGYIYWSGIAGYSEVVLRKLAYEDGAPLKDAKFTIYKGAKPIVGTDINGVENVTVFTSGESGVFFAGTLDYGTYYVSEVTAPSAEGYGGNAGHWFYLIVDKSGVYMSGAEAPKIGGYDTRAEAEAAAKAKNDELREAAKAG